MAKVVGLYGSTLGKKVLMAVTGIILFLYLVGHMLGNLQIFMDPAQIDKYAHLLHASAAFLWSVRMVLLFCLAGGGRSVLAVTALCASVSLGIETGQLFFAGRVTETQDLILNTLGGALGAWVGMQLRWCRTTGVTEHEHSKGGERR